jgi:hypothetical protein
MSGELSDPEAQVRLGAMQARDVQTEKPWSQAS